MRRYGELGETWAVDGQQGSDQLFAAGRYQKKVFLAHRREVGAIADYSGPRYKVCDQNGQSVVRHSEVCHDKAANPPGGRPFVQTGPAGVLRSPVDDVEGSGDPAREEVRRA